MQAFINGQTLFVIVIFLYSSWDFRKSLCDSSGPFQVNALDGLGQTALHRCARDDNVQACRILISYNVDTSIVSLQGYAANQVALENVLKILQGITATVPSWTSNSGSLCLLTDPPAVPADVESQLLEASKAGDLDQVQRYLGSYPHIVNCR